MQRPKTLSDVRALHSVSGSAIPRGQPAALLQMHLLATEKHRLEREVEMWARKTDQIARRLTQIEQQIELLSEASVRTEDAERLPPSSSDR